MNDLVPRPSTDPADYPLAPDDHELARLDRQGRVLAPASRFVLESAGITEGMRVLDIGSGAGDLAFVAADLVGEHGRVEGIDLSAPAVSRAARRAEARGLGQVAFEVADMRSFAAGGYDAVIGRLVLMYAADPAGVLRRLSTLLRPGGIVAAIEFDVHACRSVPPTPLVDDLVRVAGEAFRRGGFDMSLGPRLWSVMTGAGLEPRGMVAVTPHFGPGDPDGSGLLAGILRSSLPLIERTGVASGPALGVDTFEERLAAQLGAAGAVVAYPALYGAWSTAG